jgi:hypothetical protein
MFWVTLLPFTRFYERKQLLTLLWLQMRKCIRHPDNYTVTFNVKNRRNYPSPCQAVPTESYDLIR